MSLFSPERLERAYQTALAALLAERTPDGHWVGELSSSALSTATAISALALVQKHVPPHHQHDLLIAAGLAWLATHQNADGGWGDTVKSFSNISTTMLCRAAFYLTDDPGALATGGLAESLKRAETWLAEKYGKTPEQLAEAVRARYGKDRTFSVPILTTCALAGLVSWREVPSLPFELACLPQSWFRFVRLHVVSYALPALIAIGQAVYHHRPPRNPIASFVRRLSRKRSLDVLKKIQPSSGGFLEATPLTSFVTLSLASIGQADHPVAREAVSFLVKSARGDGSWPIDTDLATWVTTLAANALAAAGEFARTDRQEQLRQWLLRQQYRQRHPYTGGEPGGWAWTPLPGGVPDADDTPGALLALSHFREVDRSKEAVRAGLAWLSGLQNRDGGWPTFCRGWGHLPFDRSGSDLTAHVLRAFAGWAPHLFGCSLTESLPPLARAWNITGYYYHDAGLLSLRKAARAGLRFLEARQRPDGSWLPLWFGNQHAPDDENPTYGTARVLAAYRDLDMMNTEQARCGIAWLLGVQNGDGGWGGAANTPSSIEETTLAVEILVDAGVQAESAVNRGLDWLVQQVEAGGLCNPAPIGFYFAKLWYFEKLYPIIFTVAALGRARRKTLQPQPPGG